MKDRALASYQRAVRQTMGLLREARIKIIAARMSGRGELYDDPELVAADDAIGVFISDKCLPASKRTLGFSAPAPVAGNAGKEIK